LDSGEGLSSQQLADALLWCNALLDNWYIEQVRTLNTIVQNFTLSAGTYTPSATPVFADATTPITLPAGYFRALALAMALELAGQYRMEPPAAVLKGYQEARAACVPLAVRLVFSTPQVVATEHPGST
jgi:hypothetical protein